MRLRRHDSALPAALALPMLLFAPWPARAQSATTSEAAPARAEPSEAGGTAAAEPEPPVVEDPAAGAIDVDVVADPVPQGHALSAATLSAVRFASTGEAIADLPGVWVVRRGAGAAEPSIRGLGWERVVTQVGHLPLYGACPGRMDPPLTYVRPHGIHQLQVIQGIPSVSLGPSSTGGRVVARPDYERRSAELAQLEAWSGWGVDGSRAGTVLDAGLRGGAGPFDVGLGAEAVRLHDYESPTGVRIPAEQAEWGLSESLAFRPAAGQRVWHALNYVRHDRMSYPALPMDLDRTDFWQAHAGYRYRGDDSLREAALTLGLMDTDHEMSNRAKPNRGRLQARTAAISRAISGHAAAKLSLGAAGLLHAGVDVLAAERDALRVRSLSPSGQRFEDPIWPDAYQIQRGLFAEWSSPSWRDVTLRIGGRLDQWAQGARKADEAGLGRATVREGYVRFYGADALDVDRDDTLGAANALVRWGPRDDLELELGSGWSSRAPASTERYFSFAPAPGGFLVGNPALSPEHKLEVAGAVRWDGQWMALSLSSHAAWLDDYILPTALARVDVNGDGQLDAVRGFRNVGARLLGGEASAVGHLGRHVSIPTSFALVYGQNLSDARPLPEIPPWELATALRVSAALPIPWWTRVGVRVVGAQDRVDASFPENETDGFALLHVRAGVRLFEQLQLELSVENLLDTEYHEHLTREVALPVAGLPAGSELPAPGRTVFFAGRWRGSWSLDRR